MNSILIVFIGILSIGVVLLVITFLLRKRMPLPDGEMIYSDSAQTPGEVIEAKSIPLVGKPDYILKKDEAYIPIEIKTGKTPERPYKNHIAQLFAYCLLIEEHFGKRPAYGIIRYPEQEIPLEYPAGAEIGLKQTIQEILDKKRSGDYRGRLTQICRKCQEGNHVSANSYSE